ncbi:MAG: 50S ribosomal protein L24 [Deltaproteobacteria bacterium]|nr:50S ribosomal protein L24 [Deltaproteobacteria bacterium]
MMKTKIKTGDLVKVISGGKDIKGKTGKVLEVLRDGDAWRVRVEGLRMVKKHIKPQRNPKHPEGGIIEGAGSIPISNVMLMSEKLSRPVRTGASFTSDGKKQRVARGKNLKAEQV